MKFRNINILVLILVSSFAVSAQSITYFHRDIQRIGNTFESTIFGDNQTVLVPLKGTAEMDIMHRFGTLNFSEDNNYGYNDFWGLYAPSNIRIGMSYVPITDLMLGFGFTKDRLLWDFNAKYAIFAETGDDPDAFSLSYFVNAGLDSRDGDIFEEFGHRLSYFHNLMVAKKITRDFSAQLGVNYSHFNVVSGFIDENGEEIFNKENDHIAVNVMARYKISDAFSFMFDYNQPLTQHEVESYPNVCVGFDISTPMHSFQMFLGNYRWMVPQYNNVYNSNNFDISAYEDGKTGYMIGFNITRLLDMQEESLYDMILKRHPKKVGAQH